MEARKQGTVLQYTDRGFGFLMVTYKERYYFHISEWASDRLPVISERVSFDVEPPRKQGGLPCGVNVKPEPTTTIKAAEMLATPLPLERAEPPAEGGLK